MNYLEKLQAFSQEHVLEYFDELDEAQKASLIAQIEEADFSVLKELGAGSTKPDTSRLSGIKVVTVNEIASEGERFGKAGIEAIKGGKVGAVLLAGGMGTRLGSDGPKGTYNVGITRPVYIFERLIANLIKVVDQAGVYVDLFIMTSDKNNDATVSFFKEKNYFGYREEFVHFFRQEMVPCVDYNGKIYMENSFTMATSPNGNGGWYSSLVHSAAGEVVKKKGIEWLNIFAVDNVLQAIADPVFVGSTILSGALSGSKVIRKACPDEKIGNICLEDGKPAVVEYYEMTPEMLEQRDEKGEYLYNFGVILNYLFNVGKLNEILNEKLPVHVVEKKIPYMAASGEFIKPEKPNGFKFETLATDLVKLMDSTVPFEVVREKEFAPIKNLTGVDSVESARELLKKNGIEL